MTAGLDETISDGSWEKLEEQARENEQLSLQLVVPKAYLESEIGKLKELGLLSEKNGLYQSDIVILTKNSADARHKANEDRLKESAAYIKAAFTRCSIRCSMNLKAWAFTGAICRSIS
ncbi:hypothetical protein [Ruminococcus sp. NK3A76]|uniref:hypothetical protein n=1 Tax=Ruminococcus sp. NK3A76 TaxID=877411 RepID=UPI00048AC4A6|nr:hypothetical protein [Ruminococcus sp. NK3A76]